MKYLVLTFIFSLAVQMSLAQHPDSLTGTFKIRKQAGSVYTTGAYPAALGAYAYDYSADTFLINGVSWNSGNVTMGGGSDNSGIFFLPIPYPESAKSAGISGTVYISYEWDEKGNAVKIALERVVHSTLDKAALDYANTMRAVTGQKPITGVRYLIPITFSLGLNNEFGP